MELRSYVRAAVKAFVLATLAIHALSAVGRELESASMVTEVLCVTAATEPITMVYLLLEDGQFTEPQLRLIFRKLSTQISSGELYVIATSDPVFWEQATQPKITRASVQQGVKVLTTKEWLAYFFRVGKNAFFQYGRAGGDVRWVIVQGENVFGRRFGKTELQFVGQDILGRFGERRCSQLRRRIVFVSPGVQEEDLDNIARYYHDLAAANQRLDFHIYPSFRAAALFQRVRFPSLEAMPYYWESLGEAAGLEEHEKLVPIYLFSRWQPGAGEYIRYDEARASFPPQPPWKKRVILEAPN